MAQNQDSTVRRGVFDPLAAELAKVPKERREQVRRDAAIFIAGMEASAHAHQDIRPTA